MNILESRLGLKLGDYFRFINSCTRNTPYSYRTFILHYTEIKVNGNMVKVVVLLNDNLQPVEIMSTPMLIKMLKNPYGVEIKIDKWFVHEAVLNWFKYWVEKTKGDKYQSLSYENDVFQFRYGAEFANGDKVKHFDLKDPVFPNSIILKSNEIECKLKSRPLIDELKRGDLYENT